MLNIENLHVKLEEEDKQILKGVNLSLEPGKVHAIMGPNGSGKSTLSYVLSGKGGYEVTEGAAQLEGVIYWIWKPRNVRRPVCFWPSNIRLKSLALEI